MVLSASVYFILMVCLTSLLNFALSGYNVLAVGYAVKGIPSRTQHTALICGAVLAALLRIGLTLILSDLLIFSYAKIITGVLLLWMCWNNFRALKTPRPRKDSSHSTSLSEAMLKIIIADLALSLDNILAVASVSIHHHAILITGLVISILTIILMVRFTPLILIKLRWLGWVGLVIMLILGGHLIFRGIHDAWF